MNKLSTDYSRLKPDDLIAQGDQHVTAMDGNANYAPASRIPTDEEYAALLADLKARQRWATRARR
jgi:hypothetical protein